MKIDESLLTFFQKPELAWLLDRLVARIERGKTLACGTVTFSDPDELQRRAIDDLLGRRSTRGRTLSLDLGQLSGRLGLDETAMAGLVTGLRGSVENRHAARLAESAAWESLFSRWRAKASAVAPLIAWIEGLSTTGQLKRASGRNVEEADRLMAQAWEILEAAPHDDCLLASLAARVTGDSHALDRGRPLATLCLRAISHLHDIDGTVGGDDRREAWAAIGVSVDDLSAPALCLNLRAAPGEERAEWIGWHVERGEPFYLSWRQARKFLPDPAMDRVHVCENPAILSEAANRLGADSRPLICLNGVPSGPVRVLLRRLRDAGIPLRIRADFDWAGLRILDRLHEPGKTKLWRMTAADYQACHPSQPLAGNAVHPGWGIELAAAMEEAGRAGYEEELVDVLMEDLRQAGVEDESPE